MGRCLERIAESVAHAIIVFSLDGRVEFANASAEHVLGINRSEIIGRTHDDPVWNFTTLDLDPIPHEELPFSKAMKTKKPVHGLEFAVGRPDGTQAIVSVSAGLLRDDQNNITGVTISYNNITGRKMAEELLKLSERRFRELLENAQLAAVILDEHGYVVFINDYLLHITGWRWEEVVWQNWFTKFIPPESLWEMTQFYFKAVSEDAISANYEYDILTRSGERRSIAFNNVFVRNAEGTVVGMASIGEDVTERRVIEQELKDSEEKYRSLINNANDAIFLTDTEGNLLEVNRKAEELTGYTKHELLKMNFAQLHPKEDIKRIEDAFREGLQKKTGFINDVAILRKDGRVVPVDLRGSVTNYAGRPIAQAIVRDMTVLRRSKELSDALNDINEIIHSTLDFDEIMRRVVVEAAKAIGSETAAIDMREDHGWVARYLYGFSEDMIGTRFTDEEAKAIFSVDATKGLVVVNDAYNDPSVDHGFMLRYSIRSFLVVPLVARDNVIGVLLFMYHSRPVTFTDIEIDFSNKLGATVALALENARRFEERKP